MAGSSYADETRVAALRDELELISLLSEPSPTAVVSSDVTVENSASADEAPLAPTARVRLYETSTPLVESIRRFSSLVGLTPAARKRFSASAFA